MRHQNGVARCYVGTERGLVARMLFIALLSLGN